jgi:5-methylcytosine-specific restriction endonuclease McrA
MNWIRLEKRLAIYHRDSFDCVWCRGVFPLNERGYGLTLDHLVPGRDHSPSNLVTSCNCCNAARGGLDVEAWLVVLRKAGHKRVRERIRTHIPIDLEVGKYLRWLRRAGPKISQMASSV